MSQENAAATQATEGQPAPGTPEYDAAMAAKYDAATGTTPQTEAPVRPVHVPEKFWNAETGAIDTEAWAKSYTELEQKQSQGSPATQGSAEGAEGQGEGSDDQAAKALESKGLNLADFSNEFAQAGALSADSYQKLEAAGIPKPMVDAYIAGQQALANQVRAQGLEAAGGEEQFNAMAAWASKGLTAGELQAYNDAVTTGTADQAKLAISGLRARYEAANGREPALLGGGNANGGQAGYGSRAEMVKAMSDPRYQKDEAYRKSVENKLAVTTAF
jgi:hypothetical protein